VAANFKVERNNILRTILDSQQERHAAEAPFPFLWRTFAEDKGVEWDIQYDFEISDSELVVEYHIEDEDWSDFCTDEGRAEVVDIFIGADAN
jgi:hypothetical protein